MKKTGANRSSITWIMENCQASRGIKQKSSGELHVFSITGGPCANVLSLISNCGAWITMKENK